MQHIAAYRSSGTIEPIMITLMPADDLTYPSFPSLGATFINKETVSVGLLSFFASQSNLYFHVIMVLYWTLESQKVRKNKRATESHLCPKNGSFCINIFTKNCHVLILKSFQYSKYT